MKGFIITLSLMLALSTDAQTAQKSRTETAPNATPLPVVTVIEVESSSRTNWDLAFLGKDDKHQPKTGDEAAIDLEQWANKKPEPDWPPRLAAEHALIARNRLEFEQLVKFSLGTLLYTQSPVRLASKENGLTLLLTSLGSQHVYNTLRFNAKQRAAKEIESTVLAEIKQFRIIDTPTIKNYGVISIFGSRDFSDEDSSPKPELVALIAPASACRKLIGAEITEEDFVALSDVYIVDRDQVTGEVRKIKISLGSE